MEFVIGIVIGLFFGAFAGVVITSMCVMAKKSDVTHESYSPPNNYCGEEAIQTITHPVASREEIERAKASTTISATIKINNPKHMDNGGFEGFM